MQAPKFSQILIVLAVIAAIGSSLADAHKKFYSAPQYEQHNERCICDCGVPQHQPVLPNKPFYGSGGYAQQPPRPSGGYGNAGAFAVSGSYGSGGSQPRDQHRAHCSDWSSDDDDDDDDGGAKSTDDVSGPETTTKSTAEDWPRFVLDDGFEKDRSGFPRDLQNLIDIDKVREHPRESGERSKQSGSLSLSDEEDLLAVESAQSEDAIRRGEDN